MLLRFLHFASIELKKKRIAVIGVDDNVNVTTPEDYLPNCGEREITFPYLCVRWKDSILNNRATLLVVPPSGTTPSMLSTVVGENGNEVKITYKWKDEVLHPEILSCLQVDSAGRQYYPTGHSKNVGLGEAIQSMKGGSSANNVESVFTIELPFQCEEQFCDLEVPQAMSFKTMITEKKRKGLPDIVVNFYILELMGVRSNYQAVTAYEEDVCFMSPALKKAKVQVQTLVYESVDE